MQLGSIKSAHMPTALTNSSDKILIANACYSIDELLAHNWETWPIGIPGTEVEVIWVNGHMNEIAMF